MLKPAFAALAALTVSSAALAEGNERVSFRYQEHELASAEGAAAVYARMELRARKSCDPHGDRILQARDACAAALINQWVEEIGDSNLSAIHNAEA